jgi:hypothetical protein
MARGGSLHGQQGQRYVLPMMAVNLCTGTALQLLAQYVTDLVRRAMLPATVFPMDL